MLGVAPSKDSSGKNEGFSSESPSLNMFHVILVVTSQHPGRGAIADESIHK